MVSKFVFFLNLFFLSVLHSHAQSKQYIYYLNDQMQVVPKEQATIVGKGSQRDSIFLMQFYRDSKLFQIDMFRDSTLSEMQGQHLVYNTSGKIAEKSFYKNNMLHGASVKWDSLGRVTDSVVYYEEMPTYLIKYNYVNGNVKKVYEFDNEYAKMPLDENAIVISTDGNRLDTELWKGLMYIHRYALTKDKISNNTYLIYRLSDDFYNKMVAKDPMPKQSDFFKTGQDFALNETDINGNKLRSKDLKGKVLVINYWFIGCKPCRMEMPELNELVKEYKDSSNVKFIAISLDDRAAIKDFLKLIPFNYQIVADGTQAAHKYGIHLYPTHVIVGGDGKVYFHTVSSPRQLFYWMRKTINELLEKQRIQVGSAKL